MADEIKKEGLATCIGECACEQCGFPMFEGDTAYCIPDTDGSLAWFCQDHVPTAI